MHRKTKPVTCNHKRCKTRPTFETVVRPACSNAFPVRDRPACCITMRPKILNLRTVDTLVIQLMILPTLRAKIIMQGGSVDQQLKQLMKELGDAINESLADSDSIAEVVSRIKEGGYDIFLVLEATIGVSKQGEKAGDKTSLVTTLTSNPTFKVNDQDLKFLKSLRIKIDEDVA